MKPSPASSGTARDERLTAWRRETPGCAVPSPPAHLNNAGASLLSRPVIEAVEGYQQRELLGGGYETAAAAEDEITEAYARVARLVGAERRNIALVGNATEAFAQALLSLDFAPGDVIVTSRVDYPSNQVQFLSLAERRGVVVERAEDLPEGGVDPDSVRRLARHPRCRLVALSWIPTSSGLVQPAAEVGAVTRELGVPYLIDACQAVGQMPVDVSELGCDFLAATGRKFLRAPRGTGFLYVADRVLEGGSYPLTIDLHGATWDAASHFSLHDDASRFESWEFNYALVLGLGEAARYAREVGLEEIRRRSWALAERARERLSAIPGVRSLESSPVRCAIATFEVEGWEGPELVSALREKGVHTSSVTRESGVLYMEAQGLSSALRVSPHYYNTEGEIERLAESLEELQL